MRSGSTCFANSYVSLTRLSSSKVSPAYGVETAKSRTWVGFMGRGMIASRRPNDKVQLMQDDGMQYSDSGDIATDVSQRIAMVRHFASTGQLPFFQQIDSVTPPTVSVAGRECVLLGSNSYIGLSKHPDVIAASVKATEDFGSGTTGSRLLNGTYSLHVALEQQIARGLGREGAVVFTTGYQTNVGTIQGLLGPDCLAVVDSYVHASIRDGVRLSQAVEAKFAHNDAASLAAPLRRTSSTRSGSALDPSGSAHLELRDRWQPPPPRSRSFRATRDENAGVVSSAMPVSFARRSRPWTSHCTAKTNSVPTGPRS